MQNPSLNNKESLPIQVPMMDVTLDRKGVMVGLVFSVVLCVLIFVGSNRLKSFDGALAGYCFSTVFALFGVVYRYAVWLQRPATKLYWKRGWQLFWEPGKRIKNTLMFFVLAWEKLLEQRFIRQRSRGRWAAHQFIFWGCLLAIAVTFPLTFGWLHFASLPERPDHYYMVLFGFDLTFTAFAARSVVGWLYFHMLNISAVLCLIGITLAVGRRMKDEAELTTQRFDNDMMPLILLFAVCVTGMMLTISNMFMEGKFYYWITTTHAVTVMLWLLYLPFGKFFHIFQRIANVGVWFYKAAGETTEQGKCARCGDEYISLMHQQDIKTILPELGFDYTHQQADNWQNLCPSCRRKMVTANQFRVSGKEFM
ncbi:respiratory nitrate reductase subunit gamma [Deinococcus cellulosilyticus]|uniref:Uncharacterized protein n=1 Tax=Deinococcus cellulosilyticus (strain DSM 18568 / NBRC 106333 / KACC 11606 / 5516J-15) TaxID=1223518 RepID=A0A511NAH0_DEIC1|nr:respiratory nitrate reductase subunit gamma [Deinococcus cellulosilyticus]GEM49567.1 hypothetical protein DC3_52020 [Deinococcus cellulosilyticus NBRC 106333 = KACC 11606]